MPAVKHGSLDRDLKIILIYVYQCTTKLKADLHYVRSSSVTLWHTPENSQTDHKPSNCTSPELGVMI